MFKKTRIEVESDGGVKTLVSIHGDQRRLLLKGDI